MAQTSSQLPTPQLNDYLHPFIAESFNYDDNLLRLSDDQRGQFDGGSDTYKSTQAGLLFNAQEGRQILTGYAKASKVTFDRFDQLDYTGKDFLTDLNWILGNHLQGHIGYNYTSSLAPFSDFHSTVRNLRTDTREYANGTWRFHPSWDVVAKFTHETYNYESVADAGYNRTEDTSILGFDYLLTSGTKVGVQWSRLKTTYPVEGFLNGVFFDNGFVQDDVKLNVYWPIYGQTTLLFLGGWTKRKNEVLSDRNASGFNGRLIVNWQPRESLQFSGVVWREFGVAEGAFISGALSKGESINGSWALTSKTSLTGSIKHERRDFSPFSGEGFDASVLPASDFTDNSRDEAIGFNYMPVPQITLSLNVFHSTRTGALAAGTDSYRAKGISFTASGQF